MSTVSRFLRFSLHQRTCLHRLGGVNVAFVDGHVDFKNDEIDLAVWQALATINGGEIIPGE